jgi:hypothetical protein
MSREYNTELNCIDRVKVKSKGIVRGSFIYGEGRRSTILISFPGFAHSSF